MNSEIIFLLFITIFRVARLTNICTIEDEQDSCVYTVKCQYHAGSTSNPSCDGQPYVTFIVTNSETDTLTAAFFGSTNFDSRVRIFKAVNNSWNNIETLAFRYYAKTFQMDLSSNNIHNIRNEAFKNLILLDVLNLSRNAIVTLNSRSLYFSESIDPDLFKLDLSYNKLTELSGDMFNDIPKLRFLYLNNNGIKTIKDDSFNRLKKLEHLHLQHNYLVALDMTLINLKSLELLDVSYNLLEKVAGYEINRMTSLQKVNMSHNEINLFESNCFNQAFSLETVDLSYNKIGPNLENVLLINNNKLNYLNLYDNKITTIQENSFQHNVLNYLNLEKNNLSGYITENTFRGVKNITKLNLFNQNITGINDHSFMGMENLLSLNMSRNKINKIAASSFKDIISLKTLDLSYNNVNNLIFLNNSLPFLTEINLNNNNLTIIPQSSFSNHSTITKLDLSTNKIVTIEQFALPLENLQHILLNGNQLSGVIKKNTYSPAKFLRNLDLSNFHLTEVENESFIDLPLVAKFNLSHNEIDVIEPNNFIGMDNMYSLDLSYNKLYSFSFINSSLSSLKALYLRDNRLSDLSKAFSNISGLLYLDASNNNISDVTKVMFKDLPNLKVLMLAHNNISYFNNPQINNLTNLVTLDLSSNNIKNIDVEYFKEIVDVNLHNNKLSSIKSTFFKNLDHLQSLDISSNNISEIAPGTFQHIKILKLLNISNNHLTNFRYGSFTGLHRIEVLDISKNNINKLDVDIFHECTEIIRLILDYNHLKSFDVERLITILPKLKTLSLGGNPVSCKEIVRNIKNINRTMLRQVEVTSMDKIYHEDNVNGIKCGETQQDVTTHVTDFPEEYDVRPVLSMNILVIWCVVLTVLVAAVGVIAYFFKSGNGYYRPEPESRVQLRSSLEMNGSEFQSDLLS